MNRERELTHQIAALQYALSQRPTVERLERTTASWRAAYQEATSHHQGVSAECAALRKRVAELGHELHQARRANDGTSGRHEDVMRAELELVRIEAQKVPGLEQALVNRNILVDQYEARKQQLTAENASLRMDAARVAQLESALLNREAEAQSVAAYVRELEGEITFLRHNTSSATVAQADAFKSRAEVAEDRVRQLTIDSEALHRRTGTLEAALDARNHDAQECEAKLRREAENLRVEASKVPALEKTLTELRIQAQRAAGLEMALAQCDDRATRIGNHARQLEDDGAKLLQNVDLALVHAANMASRADGAEERLQHSQNEVAAMHTRLKATEIAQEGLVARAEAAESRVRALESDNRGLRACALQVKESHEETISRFHKIEDYLMVSNAKVTELEEELDALRAELRKASEPQPVDMEGHERTRSERDSLLAGMRELLPPGAIPALADASEVLRAVEGEYDRLCERAASLEQRYDARASWYAILQIRVKELECGSRRS
ncbi:unnamed protein product [Peniophora sp. CBMAI 1063]|nr:unnamed protein product [Peniophora sp. CBMAI 1063]